MKIRKSKTGGVRIKRQTINIRANASVLDVRSEAEILSDQNHVMPEIGLSVVLECPAVGNPQPKVEWFRDNAIISNSARTEVGDDKLTIRHLEIFDDGVYTCKATNQFGSAIHE